MPNWEKVFLTETPDEVLKDGELAHMRYYNWQGNVALFKISCSCGGQTLLIPTLCERIDATHQLQGVCMKCEKRLSASVHFFHD